MAATSKQSFLWQAERYNEQFLVSCNPLECAVVSTPQVVMRSSCIRGESPVMLLDPGPGGVAGLSQRLLVTEAYGLRFPRGGAASSA